MKKMASRKSVSSWMGLGFLICIMIAALASPAAAQPAAEFYKGKTVTILIGYDPGSDFDVQARSLAPFLNQALGTKAISVVNRPGASGSIARNELITTKPDGLTIALDHGPRLVFNGLLNAPGVKYDWKKFIWIGKLLQENVLVAVAKNLPWAKPQDMVGQTIVMGVSRPFYEPLVAESLGWTGIRLVPGYQSPAERAVAISRGELQASIGNTASFVSNWDTMKPIVITFRHSDYPKVPTVRETMAAGQEKWLNALESFQKIQYAFIAPPEVPADRIAFIEAALGKLFKDKEVRKKMDAMQLDFTPEFMGAKDLKAAAEKLADLSGDEIKQLRFIIEEKYVKKK